ncbi:hypothetical protein B0H13DRAFT_1899551 [Mycena leptocephala]|nr:hypothetical protein B0H13DRAFT_1899551 [Mycena leptocephala]
MPVLANLFDCVMNPDGEEFTGSTERQKHRRTASSLSHLNSACIIHVASHAAIRGSKFDIGRDPGHCNIVRKGTPVIKECSMADVPASSIQIGGVSDGVRLVTTTSSLHVAIVVAPTLAVTEPSSPSRKPRDQTGAYRVPRQDHVTYSLRIRVPSNGPAAINNIDLDPEGSILPSSHQ